MAPRPPRGRTVGAHTRVGEIRVAFRPALGRLGLGERLHPSGAAPGLRADPSLLVSDAPRCCFGPCECLGLGARSPEGAGRRIWGVSAGRGGGRASNPGAACGSGRIRELAL